MGHSPAMQADGACWRRLGQGRFQKYRRYSEIALLSYDMTLLRSYLQDSAGQARTGPGLMCDSFPALRSGCPRRPVFHSDGKRHFESVQHLESRRKGTNIRILDVALHCYVHVSSALLANDFSLNSRFCKLSGEKQRDTRLWGPGCL